METKRYALITGASSGLGREFAVQCAGRGMNLILMALPNENTGKLARALEQAYDVDVLCFEVDAVVSRDRVARFKVWLESSP